MPTTSMSSPPMSMGWHSFFFDPGGLAGWGKVVDNPNPSRVRSRLNQTGFVAIGSQGLFFSIIPDLQDWHSLAAFQSQVVQVFLIISQFFNV